MGWFSRSARNGLTGDVEPLPVSMASVRREKVWRARVRPDSCDAIVTDNSIQSWRLLCLDLIVSLYMGWFVPRGVWVWVHFQVSYCRGPRRGGKLAAGSRQRSAVRARDAVGPQKDCRHCIETPRNEQGTSRSTSDRPSPSWLRYSS